MIYIIIVILIILVLYVISCYNSLVALRNTVREAFATMDVYLKQRWDLIPNIVETVKGYAKHEKDTLEGVIKLRNGAYDAMTPEEKIEANKSLTQGNTGTSGKLPRLKSKRKLQRFIKSTN